MFVYVNNVKWKLLKRMKPKSFNFNRFKNGYDFFEFSRIAVTNIKPNYNRLLSNFIS